MLVGNYFQKHDFFDQCGQFVSFILKNKEIYHMQIYVDFLSRKCRICTYRLDFLWQFQAREEKLDMEALQSSNKRILFNLLPAHVAMHFLDNQFRNNLVNKMFFPEPFLAD